MPKVPIKKCIACGGSGKSSRGGTCICRIIPSGSRRPSKPTARLTTSPRKKKRKPPRKKK
jgi:hypothetical protein